MRHWRLEIRGGELRDDVPAVVDVDCGCGAFGAGDSTRLGVVGVVDGFLTDDVGGDEAVLSVPDETGAAGGELAAGEVAVVVVMVESRWLRVER